MTNNTVPIPHIFYVLLYIQSKIKHNSRLFKTVFTKVRIKSDKQKNVAKLLADRRFRKMA